MDARKGAFALLPARTRLKGNIMKNTVHLRGTVRLAGVALAAGAFMCLGAGAALAATTTAVATQTDATASSMTFEFDAMPENCTITMGNVELYSTDASGVETITTVPAAHIEELTSQKAVITNLASGNTCSKIRFNYSWTYSTGTTLTGYTDAYNPVTVAAKTDGFKIRSQFTNALYFSFNNPGVFFGYDIKLTGNDGKTKTLNQDSGAIWPASSSTIDTGSLKTSIKQVYKAQVRTYVKVGKEKTNKKYSEWSDTVLLVPQPRITGSRYATYAKAKWNKVAGAKSYTVYGSTKSDKGFKKVTTTSKLKCTIKKVAGKKMKKSKTYYFYVVANAKLGGKTYTSPVFYEARA